MLRNIENFDNNWPEIDRPERAREADQIKLVKRILQRILAGRPLELKITTRLVKLFLQVCDIVAIFEHIAYEDSVYPLLPENQLPLTLPTNDLLDSSSDDKLLRPVDKIPGMDELIRIAKELEYYPFIDIDDALIVALDNACETVWRQRETEQRCEEQLAETDDAIQRAAIYLEMGREDDAFREFQKVTQEELANPDNALDLVELTEKFQNKTTAIRLLKRWFLLDIILHPFTYDLVADILFPGLIVKQPVRVNHLRDILDRSEIDSLETIRKGIVLALPAQTQFLPDQIEIEERLRQIGTSPQELNMAYEDDEEIDLYSLITDLCSQLNHLASLCKDLDNRKLAFQALERGILMSLSMFFLPSRQQDIQQVFGYGSYNLCHDWVVENLQEAYAIFKDVTPQTESERVIASRLISQFENIRNLAEKISHHQTIEAESQK